jgi:hypothetical protein
VTTKWKKRGQALCDGKPHLTTHAPGRVNSAVPGPGSPVPEGYRGTVYAPRNPMHDTAAMEQEEGAANPIRQQLKQRGVK